MHRLTKVTRSGSEPNALLRAWRKLWKMKVAMPVFAAMVVIGGVTSYSTYRYLKHVDERELATAARRDAVEDYTFALNIYANELAQREACEIAVDGRAGARVIWLAIADEMATRGNATSADYIRTLVEERLPTRSIDECPPIPSPPIKPLELS